MNYLRILLLATATVSALGLIVERDAIYLAALGIASGILIAMEVLL